MKAIKMPFIALLLLQLSLLRLQALRQIELDKAIVMAEQTQLKLLFTDGSYQLIGVGNQNMKKNIPNGENMVGQLLKYVSLGR